MNEFNKIQEAKYFYSQMIKEKENNEEFKYNLSAFLSASRSVLQYALEEAGTKSGGQKWYEDQVTNNRIVSFLKDKRDINIHDNPISPKRDIALQLSETVHIGESATMVIKDKDGNIKGQSTSVFHPFKSSIEKGLILSKYSFSDWQGDEDLFDICKEYLKELEIIVKDGKNKGFLT